MNKIYILILENQNTHSTETNYFAGLRKQFCGKSKKYLFNENIQSINFQYVKCWKQNNVNHNKKLLEDCNDFIKPNILYGIIDNDDAKNLESAKKCFNELSALIPSCNENNKILLPPESMTFEYFLSLHIIKNEKICLDQNQTNENLKKEFNIKDLKKIKSDKQIFFKSFQNGTELLFDNVNKHTNQHQYKEFVETIFHKPNKVKTI